MDMFTEAGCMRVQGSHLAVRAVWTGVSWPSLSGPCGRRLTAAGWAREGAGTLHKAGPHQTGRCSRPGFAMQGCGSARRGLFGSSTKCGA